MILARALAAPPLESWADASMVDKLWVLLTTQGQASEVQFVFASAALAVMLAAVAWRTLQLHRRSKTDPATPHRWTGVADKLVAAALLVAALLSSVHYFYGSRNYDERSGRMWLQPYDIYHQVVGSQFFGELGYFKLYECTWEIDEANSQHFEGIKKLRNIETLEIGPTKQVVGERDCADRFTPERREQFARMIDGFHELGGTGPWQTLLTDKGFNGTPFHAWMIKTLTAKVEIAEGPLIRLALIDVALMFIAFGLVAWAWDVKTAAIVMLFFFANAPNRWLYMGGSILRFDYIAALIAALALMKKDKFALAGILVAYACMERAFPAIFVVGLGFKAGVELLATRKLAAQYVQFFVALAVTGLVLLLCSLTLTETMGEGVQAWLDWYHNMKVHTQHTRGLRVGFKHMFMMDGNLTDKAGFVPFVEKTARYQPRAHFYYLSVVVLFAPLLLATRKLDAVTFTALFAALGFFMLTIATRYYYSMMVLFLLVDRKLFEDRKQLLSAALLFLTAVWLAQVQLYTSHMWFHYNTATSAAFAGYWVIMAAVLFWDPWLRDRMIPPLPVHEPAPSPTPAPDPGG
jgi:hypothetical protein